MRTIIVLAACALSITCNFFGKSTLGSQKIVTEESVEINKILSPFETYNFEEHPFRDYTVDQVKSLMGLSSISLKDTSDIEETNNKYQADSLPENFDSRQKWPNCIHAIRDQGHCGSCWAHAASEVLSDRFCIASNGEIDVTLSPQDMVSCDYFDHGCNGGILTASWIYLRFFGIVSDECKPYTSGKGAVESCPIFKSKCSAEGQTYKKYKAKNFYYLPTINEIKQNILEKGPIETGFSVYSDFMDYKSGIYKRGAHASMLGGHAVKIIGWGKEDETEYWIVANSWSEKWGENGFFRIAFRECGIENVIAGDPAL